MRRAVSFATACVLMTGFAVKADEPAPPAPPAGSTLPAQPSPTRHIVRFGRQTQLLIVAPAGAIQVQIDPDGSRVRLSDRRGLTVELSEPPAVMPGEPQPPQLKDVILQSVFQTLATHPTVRVGNLQLQFQAPARTAPAAAVPDAKLELGAPADPESDEAPAVPVKPRPVESLPAPAIKEPVALPPVPSTENDRVEKVLPLSRQVEAIEEYRRRQTTVQPNPAVREFAAIQKELADLTKELRELSRKKSVKGKTLQEIARRIAGANERLEAAHSKLAR